MTSKYADKRILEPHFYYATPSRVVAGYRAAATSASLGGGRIASLKKVENAIRESQKADRG